MDQRCAGFHRGHEVAHRRQRLVLDLDQTRGLGGDLLGERGDARHDLPLEPHHVLGEQGAVLHEPAEPHVGKVLLGEHGDHARQGLRLGGVDADDASVRMVGVAEAARTPDR